MAIRQDRYVAADTNKIKKVDIIEVPQIPDDPVLRRSDVQQQVNNSTLPVSSRAVNLAIESINSDLDLKADKSELEGLATEDYVNEKIDEKEVGITEPELISKSVGSDKWLREGAYGVGTNRPPTITNFTTSSPSQFFEVLPASAPPAWGIKEPSGGILMPRNARPIALVFPNRPELSITYLGSAGWSDRFNFYTEYNTRTDKNNVLHSGTGTPLNTLNTSDMADTVVDNDLLTVTSGAVFRAIKQLTDQIISLEARVRELEDGGV